MKHLQTYIIAILIFCLVPTSLTKRYQIQQMQILAQVGGQVQMPNNRTLCDYIFVMASKYAYVQLICGEKVDVWRFHVSERLEYEQYDLHLYSLTNLTNSSQQYQKQITNFVRVAVWLGMEWQYTIIIKTNDESEVFIQGKYVTNELSISYAFIIYTVLSLVVLPPQLIYYENMQGLSIYSIFLTILLSLSVFINLCVIAWKYMQVLMAQFQFEHGFGLLLIMISLATAALHIYYKNRSFVRTVFRLYPSNRSRMLCIALVWGLSLIGLLYYVKIHKDVSTYIFFASGTVYYMSTFFMCSHMKKYYFSFRIVLFDGLCIFILAACSKMYPILFYQIPNYYQLIGVYLLVMVLWIYGGIMFILINIIKQDKNNRIREQEMIEGIASTYDDSVQDTSKKQVYESQNGRRYKQMRQESLNNQDSSSSNNSGIGQNASALSSDIKEQDH